FVGRIEPIKGIDLLLKTIPYIDCRERPRLIVVGGDGGGNGEITGLRKIVGQLGIEGDVTFTGTVSQERLIHFYNAADICVIPSYYESFGLVAVESLACGTPVVASRVGGLLDTIKDGKNGYLVPWHCPEPFAERMELLLENEALRSRFGLQARASVERLSWPQIAERVLQVYKSVVESYKPNK
ncbi:MAG: glycosyltransferase, partial [Dehalococcoidia bacterium]